MERAVEERPDPILLAFGREEHDRRLSAGQTELYPSLASKRLVGHDLEANLLRPERKSLVLVGSRYARGLEMLDHRGSPHGQIRALACSREAEQLLL